MTSHEARGRDHDGHGGRHQGSDRRDDHEPHGSHWAGIQWIGHELRAEAEITSDAALTLVQAHDVAERAHHHLLHEAPRLGQATISSPSPGGGGVPHALTDPHFHHAGLSQPD